MAGEWIKFETTTPDKPEVVNMAAMLNIDQDAVVGKLLRIWIWADENSVNGEAVTVTDAFIDRLTFTKKFSSAMRSVGWLTGNDGSLTFPKFDRHNGNSAKTRAMTNRRVAKSRSGNGESNEDVTPNVTVPALQKPLPEKRREEEKEEAKEKKRAVPALALPDGVSPQTWSDWLALRKTKKAPVTETVLTEAKREADKAGMPLERFLTIWCARGSQGLQAEWLKPDERRGGPSAVPKTFGGQNYSMGFDGNPMEAAA